MWTSRHEEAAAKMRLRTMHEAMRESLLPQPTNVVLEIQFIATPSTVEEYEQSRCLAVISKMQKRVRDKFRRDTKRRLSRRIANGD